MLPAGLSGVGVAFYFLFPVLVGSLERTCLKWPNLVQCDAKDFSKLVSRPK